jgi:hypothetical protein
MLFMPLVRRRGQTSCDQSAEALGLPRCICLTKTGTNGSSDKDLGPNCRAADKKIPMAMVEDSAWARAR